MARNGIVTILVVKGLPALLFLVLLVHSACTSKPVDKTPPKGSIAYTISDDGEFAAALFRRELVLLHDGKEEMRIPLDDINGMNFTPSGVSLIHRGGARIFNYRDYGGKSAQEFIEKLRAQQSGEGDYEDDDEEEADSGTSE